MPGVKVSQMDPAVAGRWMAARTTHGAYRDGKETREHRIWRGMLARCMNRRSKDYPRYGGAGVQVCARWLRFESFLTDMGACPADHQIDRYPNTYGNYEATNCRWATCSEQQKNRRTTKRYEHNSMQLTSSELAAALGISRALMS